jgi:trigger factor
MAKYTHSLKKLPKNTTEIKVNIPKEEISGAYERAADALAQDLEVEGFRKGKAPKDLARKHLSKEKVYNKLVQDLLSLIYQEIVTVEKLQPIVSPRLDLEQAKENEDWIVLFKVAERPTVELGEYKKKIQDVKASKKVDEIWVPGKEEKPEDEKAKAQKQQLLLNDILNEILKTVKVDISDIIIEEEMNTRLTRLVDDVQKIGMTMESYLKSKNLSEEDLQNQYRREIEDTHKIEFAINAIADAEKIEVEEKELANLFGSIKDEREKQMVAQNAYYYAALLRKQKTLDFLLNL